MSTATQPEGAALTVNADGSISDADGAVVGHVAQGTAGATRPAMSAASRKMTMLRPIASPAEVLQVQEETRAFVEAALTEGRDYGVFPGVDKKSLFKPGAERVCAAFNVYPRFRIVEKEVDHDRDVPWRKVKAKYEGPRGNRRRVGEEVTEGRSLGLYRYVVECELINRETGEVVGSAIASCSTMESKYIDRPRDSENTILQMAEKRAHVASTRTTFGLSEQFTQDIEDNPDAYKKGDGADDPDAVKCPKCHGPVWDNRAENDTRVKQGKSRRPDYACRNKDGCGEVIWSAEEWAKKLAENDAHAGTPRATAPDDAPPPRAPKPAREKRMPFGDHKDKKLGEITANDLVVIRDWAQKRDAARFAELIDSINEVLEEKRQATAGADGVDDLPPALDEDDDLPL